MGEHLRELDAVEAEARRSVEQVTRTLANTAAVFGPLVGGATVALAGAMGSAGPLASGGTVDGLGLVVGAYVLVLAAILTALSTGLSRGFDARARRLPRGTRAPWPPRRRTWPRSSAPASPSDSGGCNFYRRWPALATSNADRLTRSSIEPGLTQFGRTPVMGLQPPL